MSALVSVDQPIFHRLIRMRRNGVMIMLKYLSHHIVAATQELLALKRQRTGFQELLARTNLVSKSFFQSYSLQLMERAFTRSPSNVRYAPPPYYFSIEERPYRRPLTNHTPLLTPLTQLSAHLTEKNVQPGESARPVIHLSSPTDRVLPRRPLAHTQVRVKVARTHTLVRLRFNRAAMSIVTRTSREPRDKIPAGSA